MGSARITLTALKPVTDRTGVQTPRPPYSLRVALRCAFDTVWGLMVVTWFVSYPSWAASPSWFHLPAGVSRDHLPPPKETTCTPLLASGSAASGEPPQGSRHGRPAKMHPWHILPAFSVHITTGRVDWYFCRHLNQDLFILTIQFSFCIWSQCTYF